MAEVTFIMPAYNVSDYIEEAIRSLQAQTMTEWKLIVVDDGSTDGTRDIVAKIAADDDRVTILHNPAPSGGAYQPRRKAILAAETPYVSPLDADDSVEPQYLERLWKVLTEEEADMVFPVMMTEKGPMADYSDFEGKVFKGRDCVKHTLTGWRINCNGGIIRKKIYEEAYKRFGGDLNYSYADELLTRQLLIMAGRVAFVPAIYHYRYNPDSVTHNISKGAFDFIKCHLDLKKLIEEEYGRDTEEYKLVNRQLFHDYFTAMRLSIEGEMDAETAAYSMEEMKRCREAIDRKMIRNGVSRRLSLLFPFPPKIAGTLMKRVKKFFKV